jgi:hypothetical protein
MRVWYWGYPFPSGARFQPVFIFYPHNASIVCQWGRANTRHVFANVPILACQKLVATDRTIVQFTNISEVTTTVRKGMIVQWGVLFFQGNSASVEFFPPLMVNASSSLTRELSRP